MRRLAPGRATVAVAAAFLVFVIARSPQRTDSSAERRDPQTAGMRLYVFDCGTLQVDPARFRLKREEVATRSSV